FASGVSDAPLNPELLKELPALLEQSSPRRILLLASAGCEGSPEINQQLMKDRANWAKSAMKGLAQGASLEIGYRDPNRCTSEDEPRPDDRYVTIVPLK
ncbi:MAG: hypothetical protein KDK33_19445, partial [Leptospiraceae bacterium]|nr:hypothetical protein [Leptospiraceae bacterium]